VLDDYSETKRFQTSFVSSRVKGIFKKVRDALFWNQNDKRTGIKQ
jgi:hypothetical protein